MARICLHEPPSIAQSRKLPPLWRFAKLFEFRQIVGQPRLAGGNAGAIMLADATQIKYNAGIG